jgi:hypothetical protein
VGLALISAAGRAWPGSLTICLAHRVLAVAWLVRGANAPRSGIRHARHGYPGRDSVKEPVMAVVMIGIDPRKGSHTAAAIGPWGGAAGPAELLA